MRVGFDSIVGASLVREDLYHLCYYDEEYSSPMTFFSHLSHCLLHLDPCRSYYLIRSTGKNSETLFMFAVVSVGAGFVYEQFPFHALQMRKVQREPIISGFYSPFASLLSLFFPLFKYSERSPATIAGRIMAGAKDGDDSCHGIHHSQRYCSLRLFLIPW